MFYIGWLKTTKHVLLAFLLCYFIYEEKKLKKVMKTRELDDDDELSIYLYTGVYILFNLFLHEFLYFRPPFSKSPPPPSTSFKLISPLPLGIGDGWPSPGVHPII